MEKNSILTSIKRLPAFVGIVSVSKQWKMSWALLLLIIYSFTSFDTLSIPFSSACGSVSELLTRVRSAAWSAALQAGVEAEIAPCWRKGRFLSHFLSLPMLFTAIDLIFSCKHVFSQVCMLILAAERTAKALLSESSCWAAHLPRDHCWPDSFPPCREMRWAQSLVLRAFKVCGFNAHLLNIGLDGPCGSLASQNMLWMHFSVPDFNVLSKSFLR